MTYEFCLIEVATTMSLSEVPDAAGTYLQTKESTDNIHSARVGVSESRCDVSEVQGHDAEFRFFKLALRYMRPFRVAARVGSVAYRLDLPEKSLLGFIRHFTFNVDIR
ncbi:hypothetical protein Scep_028012 [Stephania cephalantha]|uniref:Tf2-1-like SH3-like domain-containing protein n=1 Tax=Stephania cephalantha TaxID=152367 RepID=A0AAP0E905_9MAGN